MAGYAIHFFRVNVGIVVPPFHWRLSYEFLLNFPNVAENEQSLSSYAKRSRAFTFKFVPVLINMYIAFIIELVIKYH